MVRDGAKHLWHPLLAAFAGLARRISMPIFPFVSVEEVSNGEMLLQKRGYEIWHPNACLCSVISLAAMAATATRWGEGPVPLLNFRRLKKKSAPEKEEAAMAGAVVTVAEDGSRRGRQARCACAGGQRARTTGLTAAGP